MTITTMEEQNHKAFKTMWSVDSWHLSAETDYFGQSSNFWQTERKQRSPTEATNLNPARTSEFRTATRNLLGDFSEGY